MSNYFIYYAEANIVCVVLFLIMLISNVISGDRQEKQIKYDHALIAFILYFVCDIFWAAIISGVLPKNKITVISVNFANYVLMAAIAYTWLRYVMAVEHMPGRGKRSTKLLIQSPFYIATTALIITYFIKPEIFISDDLDLKIAYSVFQIAVPCIYIISCLIYTVKKAVMDKNPFGRSEHLYVGFLPLMVISGGLFQVLVLKETPVFCFSSTILMVIFYIRSTQTKISTDPLTGLNNRGQLLRYTSQSSNLHINGRLTFVMMLDINNFKIINDTYGHAEGDRALIVISAALKNIIKKHSGSMFLARYGGDEFILITHPTYEDETASLPGEIRDEIKEVCVKFNTPYIISVGIGYDELKKDGDSFQKCLQRADQKMYIDKKVQKELIKK